MVPRQLNRFRIPGLRDTIAGGSIPTLEAGVTTSGCSDRSVNARRALTGWTGGEVEDWMRAIWMEGGLAGAHLNSYTLSSTPSLIHRFTPVWDERCQPKRPHW
jgi:hypothetical protein